MGSCYSKKACGGNRSYTTVQMASTKLDDASRLARATPYSRALGSSDVNVDYGGKRNLPLSTKVQNSPNCNDQNDVKNNKNAYQSNIPRFSSSLPTTSPMSGAKTGNLNCNENDVIHIVNNNAVMTSHSSTNVSNSSPMPLTRHPNKILDKSRSIASRSCPDSIVGDEKNEGKMNPISRLPGKGSGLPRQLSTRYAHSVSQINADSAISKQQSKETLTTMKTHSESQEFSKSPSKYKGDSHDSLSDFDSGFGNSFTDKCKPEDSDTIKDIEQLELQEENPPCAMNTSPDNPKATHSDDKVSAKPSMYKRELNGKWSFDEKSFKTEVFNYPGARKCETVAPSSPKDRHSYKMNASENIFSTYASYKGLLSYKKKSFQPLDSMAVNTSRDKSNLIEKVNSSSIPKIHNATAAQANASSAFHSSNMKSVGVRSKSTNKVAPNSPVKSDLDSKESSIGSDDKSDTTENGVLSPTSEVENREFLIDDEISDQPELISFCASQSEESDIQSLQQTVTELHALQLASSSKKRSDSVGSYSSRKEKASADHRDSVVLGSDLGSSCSSIASDDLMLDYEKSFDIFPEGTVNEGPASPFKKLPELDDEDGSDKVAPLRIEKKFDFDENNRKWLHRRSSGPFVGGSTKSDWRSRSVSLPLRPPRKMSISEADDGSLKLDSSSYRLLCQDLNGVKTMLLRLKSVIQEAETINPFDQSTPKNIFFHSLVHNDLPSNLMPVHEKESKKEENNSVIVSQVCKENADLRRQLVLLQQQLEEKDHTIHLLQQQMTKYQNFHGVSDQKTSTFNAATQTERVRSLNNSLSGSLSSSVEGSSETLVSVQDAFEEFFSKNSQEQDHLKEHLKEVSCYISSLSSSLQNSKRNSSSPGPTSSSEDNFSNQSAIP